MESKFKVHDLLAQLQTPQNEKRNQAQARLQELGNPSRLTL